MQIDTWIITSRNSSSTTRIWIRNRNSNMNDSCNAREHSNANTRNARMQNPKCKNYPKMQICECESPAEWGQQSNQNKCTHTEIPNCNKAKSKHTTNNAACGFSHFRLTVANLIREFSTGAGCKSRKGGVASEKAINIFSYCWFCSGLPTYANYLVWFMPGIFSPSIGAVTLLLGLLGANWILQNAVDDACEGTFFTIKVAFNHFKSVNAIA